MAGEQDVRAQMDGDDYLSVPVDASSEFFSLCFDVSIDTTNSAYKIFAYKPATSDSPEIMIYNSQANGVSVRVGDSIAAIYPPITGEDHITVSFRRFSDAYSYIKVYNSTQMWAETRLNAIANMSGTWYFGGKPNDANGVNGWMDNIALLRGDLSETETGLISDSHSLSLAQLTSGAEWTQYEYSAEGLLLREENSNGVITQNTYDSLGQTTSVTTTTRENVTTRINYQYNLDKTLSMMYYDSNGNGSCDSGETYNSYTYDSMGNVSSVGHNGFTYTFGFNEWNQSTGVSVRNRNIVTNLYAADGEGNNVNGNATGVKFCGSADKTLSFTCDALGNVIGQSYNGSQIARFSYDNNGNLVYVEYVSNSLDTSYQYDAYSRLTQRSSELSSSLRFTTGYRYNSSSSVSETAYYLGDSQGANIGFRDLFSYDSKGRNTLADSGNVRATTAYDDVTSNVTNRTVSYRQSDGSYSQLSSETFEYYDKSKANPGSVKGAVSGIVYTGASSGNDLRTYTYDSLGRVTSELRGTIVNGARQTTVYCNYTYDNLGQLTEENYVSKGIRYAYTYDNGGNLTEWSKYKITDGVESTVSTYTYNYGDSGWKDMATKINTLSCYYDNMGNPMSMQVKASLGIRAETLPRLRLTVHRKPLQPILIMQTASAFPKQPLRAEQSILLMTQITASYSKSMRTIHLLSIMTETA